MGWKTERRTEVVEEKGVAMDTEMNRMEDDKGEGRKENSLKLKSRPWVLAQLVLWIRIHFQLLAIQRGLFGCDEYIILRVDTPPQTQRLQFNIAPIPWLKLKNQTQIAITTIILF